MSTDLLASMERERDEARAEVERLQAELRRKEAEAFLHSFVGIVDSGALAVGAEPMEPTPLVTEGDK